MSMHRAIAATLIGVLLSGCASSFVKSGLNRLGGPATTATSVPAAGAPQVWVTLRSKGIKFSMAKLASDGAVVVWAAKDGSQMALRDGVLINTRGFGWDMMSADAPSLATLAKLGSHKRVYYDLDGTDTMRTHNFDCKAESGPVTDTPFKRHIVEHCVGDLGTIENDFWLDSSGHIAQSRQWVSQGVGYAAIEKKVD